MGTKAIILAYKWNTRGCQEYRSGTEKGALLQTLPTIIPQTSIH